MELLKEHLGRAMRTREVAEYLGFDEKTVIKYYAELGGIRLGRLYLFFEKEFINAIQKRTKMGGPSEEERQEKGEEIRHEEGGTGLGGGAKKLTRRELAARDHHGLLD